jgi:hypothetical protein
MYGRPWRHASLRTCAAGPGRARDAGAHQSVAAPAAARGLSLARCSAVAWRFLAGERPMNDGPAHLRLGSIMCLPTSTTRTRFALAPRMGASTRPSSRHARSRTARSNRSVSARRSRPAMTCSASLKRAASGWRSRTTRSSRCRLRDSRIAAPRSPRATRHMLPQARLRLVLADDPGRGKDDHVGAANEGTAPARVADRVLILCPVPLTVQWQDELLDNTLARMPLENWPVRLRGQFWR